MSISKKLKWRRSISKLRFLYDEIEYIKQTGKDAAIDFEAHYRRFCAEKNINIGELDRQHKERLDTLYGRNEITDNNTEDEPEINSADDMAITIHNKPVDESDSYQETADDIAIHDAFAKLFKKIALVLHPDKIDKMLPESEVKSRVSMFQKSAKSLEDKKYFILLEIAEKLNITTPKNYDVQIRWMHREIDRLESVLLNEKNTYNYTFATTETEEEKDNLIRKFLHQLFRMSIQ